MTLSVHSDEHFMKEAYKEAQLAYEEGEIPVGAVVVSPPAVVLRYTGVPTLPVIV